MILWNIFKTWRQQGISVSNLLLNHFFGSRYKTLLMFFLRNSSAKVSSLAFICMDRYRWFQHHVCVSWPGHEQMRFCRPWQISLLRHFPSQDANDQLLRPWGQRQWSAKNCLKEQASNKDTGCQSSEERNQSSAGTADDSGSVGKNMRNVQTCRRYCAVSLLCLSSQAVGFCWQGCRQQQMMVVITAAGGSERSRVLTPPTPRVANLWNSRALTSNKEHNHQLQLLPMNVLAWLLWC